MRLILSIFLLIVSTLSFGQKTKTLGIRGSKYYEIYDVLKKGKDIKHGSYKKYRNDDTLVVQGTYSFGKRVGVWSYYGWKGELNKQYDYEKSKIIYYNPQADTTTDIVRINGVEQRVRLEWPPEYSLGENERAKFIQENIVYPERARELGESGTVYVTFFLTKDGLAEDFKVRKGVSTSLNDEALRVVKLIPNHWNPARYKGENVDVLMTMPINFIIQ